MLSLVPLAVPTTTTFPASLSAALDLLGLDMEGSLAVQLSAAAVDGDSIDIYASNLVAATDLDQLQKIGTIGPGPGAPPGGILSGESPLQLPPPRMRFLYVNRTNGSTAGLTCLVTGQETPGTAGVAPANAILNGGNSFGAPMLIGTLDAQPVTLFSAGGQTVTVDSGTTGDVNLGTGPGGADANAKTVRVATGAAAKTLIMGSTTGASSAELLGGTGGIGIGVAPVASNVTIDTPAAGAVNIATTNATSAQLGNLTNAATTQIQANAGGTVAVQSGAGGLIALANNAAAQTVTVGNGAAAMTIDIGSAGAGVKTINIGTQASANVITMGTLTSGATTTINGGDGAGAIAITALNAGTIAINSGAAGTINIGTVAQTTAVNVGTGAGAANITSTFGSANGASTTTLQSGTGGIGVGVAAPGTSGTAVDTPAAGILTLGTTNATEILAGAATTIISLSSGGTSGWAIAAGGTLSLASSAVACTINIGANAGVKTIHIGDNAAPVNVISIGGAASELGFYGAAPVVQAARVGQLTNFAGAPAPTAAIADVGAAFSQATLNQNFTNLLTKINALELVDHNVGLTL